LTHEHRALSRNAPLAFAPEDPSPVKVPSPQRRTPQQARSRAACEAIVEAAAQILEAGGPEALTTNAVAERAGVSIGTLYQYFPDKQAILLAATHRELAAAPLARRADALVRALMAMLERVSSTAGADARAVRTARPQPRRRSTALHRRLPALVGQWLSVLVAPPLPVLRPISVRTRRSPPAR
jgi:AcrR family transcriptional regulator